MSSNFSGGINNQNENEFNDNNYNIEWKRDFTFKRNEYPLDNKDINTNVDIRNNEEISPNINNYYSNRNGSFEGPKELGKKNKDYISENLSNIESKNEFEFPTKHKEKKGGLEIEELVKKIQKLSDHQIFLVDKIEEYQKNAQTIIEEKKRTIQRLEEKIKLLSSEIQREISKRKVGEGKYQTQIPKQCSPVAENINYLIQSQNDVGLVKLISSMNLSQFKQLNPFLINKMISFLLKSTQYKKNLTTKVIKFVKNVLLGIQNDQDEETKEIIKVSLMNILANQEEYSKYLNENDFIDINLLLSHLSQ